MVESNAKRALVLAHEPDGHGGLVSNRLAERGFAVDTHVITLDYEAPDDFEPWPDFEPYDLIVAMGSIRSLVNKQEMSAWIDEELAQLRAAHDRDQPILGICFGGQLLADLLGGAVEVAPETKIGWFSIGDGPDGPNPVGPGPWMHWHHDRMVLPEGVEVLAMSENAPQLIRSGRSVGTQFHPEIDVAHIDGFLDGVTDEYAAENRLDVAQLRADVVENVARNIDQCNALVDWYIDQVAFVEGARQ